MYKNILSQKYCIHCCAYQEHFFLFHLFRLVTTLGISEMVSDMRLVILVAEMSAKNETLRVMEKQGKYF